MGNDLVPRCRKVVVFLLEGVDSLEAHVQLSWTIKFGKVCHHELWLSHGGRNRFLHTRKIRDSQTGQQVGFISSPTESPSSNWVWNMGVTYKTDLLRQLDLRDDPSSYIICEASCVTDAEGVGTWIERSCQCTPAKARRTKNSANPQ